MMLPEPPLQQRVYDLEGLMASLIAQSERTDRELALLSREMRAFKVEMLAFKDEMREFKDEMREFKDEMSVFKDEMSEFKDEMRNYRDTVDAQLIQMRKEAGELSNRFGTMVEDMVAPNIGRILNEVIGCPEERVDVIAIRVRKTHPVTRARHEFDAVALCGNYLLINETKSRLSAEIMREFAERLPTVRDYFGEYGDKQVIGAIGSLYVDESLVRYGERLGLVVLGFGTDVMQVLNSAEFRPRIF